jgi:hypothetical protein
MLEELLKSAEALSASAFRRRSGPENAFELEKQLKNF